MDLLVVMSRTIFFYFLILICYRVMGKREIAQLSVSDLTISILIAELVAISIENKDESTFLTILPILLLVFLEILLAFIQLKCNGLRRLVDGKPSMIIDDGKLNIKEMVRQRYSVDDLVLALRTNKVKNIKDVDYAILETDGSLSVFKKSVDSSYPLPIIVDGKIDENVLKKYHKSKEWLIKKLEENNLTLKTTLYAFYKGNTMYVVRK